MTKIYNSIVINDSGVYKKIELSRVNHLRLEIIVSIRDNDDPHVFKASSGLQFATEEYARTKFMECVQKAVVAEYRQMGRTVLIAKSETIPPCYQLYVGNIKARQDLTPDEMIRYLANALEDGS